MSSTPPSSVPSKGEPPLIFTLGPPCAGKSTLRKGLSPRYHLDHFSIGDELRSLISAYPVGPAALIKPELSASELDLFTQNVKADTLAPVT